LALFVLGLFGVGVLDVPFTLAAASATPSARDAARAGGVSSVAEEDP
jgi:hypothetical protein